MSFTDNYGLDFEQDFGGFGFQDNFNAPADGCTQCGICLSSCPTYKLSADIRQSPMGRIQTIRNVGGENYRYSIDDYAALDSCLVCRRCESVCPSKVAYVDMLDTAKQRLTEDHKKPLLLQLLMKLVESPLLLKLLVSTVKPFYVLVEPIKKRTKSKTIADLMAGFSYLKYANQRIDKTCSKEPVQYTSRKVTLFTGCLSSVFDGAVLNSSRELLHSCGVEVSVTNSQTCCGAIHAHNGESEKAMKLAIKNIEALEDETVEAIISTASGCGRALHDYDTLLGENAVCVSASAKKFAKKVKDISSYLQSNGVLDNFQFKTCEKVVAIHTPCSMREDAGAIDAVKSLLSRIPELKLKEIPDAIACCGAGGSHLLTHPEAAGKIRHETMLALAEIKPDIVVTSNVGCAMHLKQGIAEAAMNIEVLHPVQLLERQLQEKRRGYGLIH